MKNVYIDRESNVIDSHHLSTR